MAENSCLPFLWWKPEKIIVTTCRGGFNICSLILMILVGDPLQVAPPLLPENPCLAQTCRLNYSSVYYSTLKVRR